MKSIEPIAELFSDLDASIDSRVDDHEKGVKAEDFTGFHRIEYSAVRRKTPPTAWTPWPTA